MFIEVLMLAFKSIYPKVSRKYCLFHDHTVSTVYVLGITMFYCCDKVDTVIGFMIFSFCEEKKIFAKTEISKETNTGNN